MLIRSHIQHKVITGLKNPKNSNRAEDVTLDFKDKKPLEVPEIAKKWAQSLADTWPLKYEVTTAKSFPKDQTDDEFFEESELNVMKDDDAIALAIRLDAPAEEVPSKAAAVRWILENQTDPNAKSKKKTKASKDGKSSSTKEE